ncbi:MAG: class I SAM-dependent methyltransferase [Candidatus Sumerlaeaceae bacterium]|nr:class I SAM-dependent methyltransferase [Candidatus Sumerlaeaceae bacterium]
MNPIEQARELALSGQIPEAIALLSRHVNAGGELAMGALGHRAWFLRVSGRLAEAEADYSDMISRWPDLAEARVRRAEIWRMRGEWDRAVEEVLDVLRSHPREPTAFAFFADCRDLLKPDTNVPEVLNHLPVSVPAPSEVVGLLEQQPVTLPTSVHPALGRMLYLLARSVRPALVLEIGCYIGYSTCNLAQALEDSGRGHLHAFDIFMELKDYESPVLGPCANCYDATSGHLARAGLAHRVTLHKGDSSVTIPALLSGQEESFQMAFIDGDHSAQGCLRDFVNVARLLCPGGIAVFHDSIVDGSGYVGPRSVLERIDEETQGQFAWINLPTPDDFGLAIAQKRFSGITPKWRPSLNDLAAELAIRGRQYLQRRTR